MEIRNTLFLLKGKIKMKKITRLFKSLYLVPIITVLHYKDVFGYMIQYKKKPFRKFYIKELKKDGDYKKLLRCGKLESTINREFKCLKKGSWVTFNSGYRNIIRLVLVENKTIDDAMGVEWTSMLGITGKDTMAKNIMKEVNNSSK